jgi:hypothetical protein
MSQIKLRAPARSHLLHVVAGLIKTGWTIETVPEDGMLLRNGQKVRLRSGQADIHFRLFVYKVTGSSRGKPEERRIEITSTYQKDLARLRGYPDVVLGYDYAGAIFVGVDPERINWGGKTGNASSFFDREGLELTTSKSITVLQRKANLFRQGVEYHAFVAPIRLAEYFYSRADIHVGKYTGDGYFSGSAAIRRTPRSIRIDDADASGDVLVLRGPDSPQRRRLRISADLVEAIEKQKIRVLRRRKITPDQFLEIKRQMEENGRLGEEFALRAERRRLRQAGKPRLAERVRWISQESIGEGYDILSFETNGEKRYIEVKATTSQQNSFDMSANEWNKCQTARDSYYVYFIKGVRNVPSLRKLCNPCRLEQEGQVRKLCTGWRVTLI